jgi:hypothetical protein
VTERAELITAETQIVVDDAVEAIVIVHALDIDSLAARDLHAAVTLRNVARSRLSRLVADARDEQVSWAQISCILGTGRLLALLRYGLLVRRRRTPLVLD